MAARLFDVPISKIAEPRHNPRFEAEELEELVASIRSLGIVEPLIGVAQGEKIRLVAGKRRLAAAKVAKLQSVPMLVHSELPRITERGISMAENFGRKALSPIELGEGFLELRKDGLLQQQIAALTGASQSVVSICLTIVTKLIPEFRDACHNGELSRMDAYRLARMPEAAQRVSWRRMNKPAREAKQTKAQRAVSNSENALLAAVSYVRAGNARLALEHAEHAVGLLRKEAGKSSRLAVVR